MRRDRRVGLAVAAMGVLCACGGSDPAAVEPQEVESIAREAYVWGFPMVMN
jgi:hypothetical protein